VQDGSYFEDSLDWYFFRYIKPICDRTYLLLTGIFCVIILYSLTEMYSQAMPLKVEPPIFMASDDNPELFPRITQLRKINDQDVIEKNVSTDEVLVRFLLQNYVETRESYDYSAANIGDVNLKLSQIRHTSSADEYRSFQTTMSKDNPNSPVLNFGRNVMQVAKVQWVRLIRQEPHDFSEKAREMLITKLPNEAEVKFVISTIVKEGSDLITQKNEVRIAKIVFDYTPINRDQKGEIGFVVKSYRLFKWSRHKIAAAILKLCLVNFDQRKLNQTYQKTLK